MKKLVSLLLALLLGLTAIGAYAEATPVFALGIEMYQATFDMLLAESSLATKWTTSADGLTHFCEVENYPNITVITDAAGNIASISIDTELTLFNTATMGNNFGEMMSYTSMTALMLTDASFLNEVDVFLNILIGLLTEGLNALDTEESSRNTVTAYGADFTFVSATASDSDFHILIAFTVTPAAQSAAAPAVQQAPAAAAVVSGETFPYALENYKSYFDMFSASILGATPVWSTSADGLSAQAAIEGFGVVQITLNASGQILRYNTSIKTSAISETLYNDSNAFGQLVALTALSSKAAEDVTFISSQNNITQFTTDILALLNTLMDRMSEAFGTQISVTDIVADDTCTFTLSMALESMSLEMGFIYEP